MPEKKINHHFIITSSEKLIPEDNTVLTIEI